jgi:hypothetical protein
MTIDPQLAPIITVEPMLGGCVAMLRVLAQAIDDAGGHAELVSQVVEAEPELA